MKRRHWYHHVEPELEEVVAAIQRGRVTSPAIRNATGFGERKVQRRLRELQDRKRVKIVKRAHYGVPIYGICEESMPSAREGSTVKG